MARRRRSPYRDAGEGQREGPITRGDDYEYPEPQPQVVPGARPVPNQLPATVPSQPTEPVRNAPENWWDHGMFGQWFQSQNPENEWRPEDQAWVDRHNSTPVMAEMYQAWLGGWRGGPLPGDEPGQGGQTSQSGRGGQPGPAGGGFDETYGGGRGVFPELTLPRLSIDRYQAGDPFRSYAQGKPFEFEQFRPPTLDEARAEPGYEFARSEGLGAVEAGAGARGLSRTGGYDKGLAAWANRFAEQNYGNVYSRAADVYDRNQGNRYQTWFGNEAQRQTDYVTDRDTYRGTEARRFAAHQANTGQRLDVFDRNVGAATAEFNPRFRAAEMNFEDLYRRWRDAGNWNASVMAAGVNL